MNKTILVDVDCTIWNAGGAWKDWLFDVSVDCPDWPHFPIIGVLEYNLSSYFTMPEGVDAFDFWRNPYLYADKYPYDSAKDVLERLNKEGCNIVFVSSVKGFHDSSKYYWLKRHFPFMSGCLFTKEKHLVRGDVIIDDRLDILEKFDDNVTRIQFNTIYRQTSDFTPDFKTNDWWEIYRYLKLKEGE